MSDDALPQWLAGRRPAPTFEALLGAVGGVILLGAAAAFADRVPDDDARVAGLALSVLVLVVGCVLSAASLGRATAAAGVVLAAGAVLPLAMLLTNDPETIDSESDFLVGALVAVAFWLLLFAMGPSRGHGLFLGSALFMLWAGALSQTGPSPLFFNLGPTSESEIRLDSGGPGGPVPDFDPMPGFEVPEFESPPMTGFRPQPDTQLRPPPTFPPLQPLQPMPTFRFRPPSQENPFDEGPRPPVAGAVVSILFGLVYLLLAALLDASRLWRPASATFLVAVAALVTGSVLLGPRFGATAAGGAGMALAAFVVAAGVVASRRAVAWVGAAGLAVGVTTVVSSVFDDSPNAAAACLLVVGAAVITLGLLATTPEYPDPDPEAD